MLVQLSTDNGLWLMFDAVQQTNKAHTQQIREVRAGSHTIYSLSCVHRHHHRHRRPCYRRL